MSYDCTCIVELIVNTFKLIELSFSRPTERPTSASQPRIVVPGMFFSGKPHNVPATSRNPNSWSLLLGSYEIILCVTSWRQLVKTAVCFICVNQTYKCVCFLNCRCVCAAAAKTASMIWSKSCRGTEWASMWGSSAWEISCGFAWEKVGPIPGNTT